MGIRTETQPVDMKVKKSSEVLHLCFTATLNFQTSEGKHRLIWSDQSTRGSRSDSHDRCAALLSHLRHGKRD